MGLTIENNHNSLLGILKNKLLSEHLKKVLLCDAWQSFTYITDSNFHSQKISNSLLQRFHDARAIVAINLLQ